MDETKTSKSRFWYIVLFIALRHSVEGIKFLPVLFVLYRKFNKLPKCWLKVYVFVRLTLSQISRYLKSRFFFLVSDFEICIQFFTANPVLYHGDYSYCVINCTSRTSNVDRALQFGEKVRLKV